MEIPQIEEWKERMRSEENKNTIIVIANDSMNDVVYFITVWGLIVGIATILALVIIKSNSDKYEK